MPLVAGALEQQLALGLRQVLPRGVDVDPVRLGDGLQQPPVVHRRGLRPGLERALRDRERRVGDDQLGVDHPLEAQAVAALAAAVRRVEREDPRLELRHRRAAVEAGELLVRRAPRRACRPARRPRACSAIAIGTSPSAISSTSTSPSASCDAASIDSDSRLRIPSFITSRSTTIEMSCLNFLSSSIASSRRRSSPSITRARVALRAHLLEHAPVLALAPADDRRQDHEPRPLLEGQHPVGDLLQRLALDRLAAVVAVGLADPRPEQAQVVVDLGDRADGRARVARGASSGRSRSPARGPRSSRRRASPSGPGTGARRRRATRRSGAGPRRRSCRTRGSTCPSPRAP